MICDFTSQNHTPMKARILLAALALAAPAASFADPYRHSHGYYRPYSSPYRYSPSYGYSPSYNCSPSYGYSSSYGSYPSYGYYAPTPIVSFTFGSRPSVYPATRYYAPAESSTLEASVQRVLRKRGYYSGPVDGDIGPRSRAAIREYQAEHGLEANGRIDDPLLRSLGF